MTNPEIKEEDVVVVYTEDNDDFWNAAEAVSYDNWESDPFSKDVKFQRSLDGLSKGSKRSLTNEINKRYTGQDGAKSKAKYREQLTGYDLWDVVPPLYNLEHLALLMEKNTIHHSAVMAKVASVVSPGWELIESEDTLDKMEQAYLKDDEAEMEQIRAQVSRIRRKYTRWFDRVNAEDSLTEILEKWIGDYESMGVGALEIARTTTGKIGYVGHIPAHTIRPRKDRDGFVQIVDDRVTFFRNFGDTETPDPIGDDPRPNEIIYLKKYSPRTNYYGVPDIIPALSAVAGVEFAKQYNLDYFENKAVPKHLIIVRGARLGADAERRLISFFQTNVKGQNHRAVYIPLPEEAGPDASIEIEAIEADVQEASFERYMNLGRDEILMAHRVPLTKVGLTADINLAVARDADRTFKETVSKPLQRKVERKINMLLEEMTNIIKFNLNELTLVDEETRSKIHETYHMLGVLSTNEVRNDIGRKSIKEGDEHYDTLDSSSAQERAEQTSQRTNGRQRERDEQRSGPDSNNSDQGRDTKS